MYECDIIDAKYKGKFRGSYEPNKNFQKALSYQRLIEVQKTEYLHPHVLGMTDLRKIWIRPPEKLPYGLFDFVLRHEVEHILDPEAGEETVDRRAGDASRDETRKKVKLAWYN